MCKNTDKVIFGLTGDELNRAVAEEVMGWRLEVSPTGSRGVTAKNTFVMGLEDFNPSQDLNRAMQVVRATKMIVKIEGHYHTGWEVTLSGVYVQRGWILPETICNVALSAVVSEKKQSDK